MTPLELHAECFAAAGGMAADGMKKLLGTPTLTLLQTVIREAVQNSWDARRGRKQVQFHIALRRLGEAERDALRSSVFAEMPPHRSSAGPLRDFLRASAPLVLEMSDWGTLGLGGPSRADVVPASGERNDFVNFVRNMGARRDTAQGGGTYGYGKSSLYVMSRCATVLIDSLSLGRGGRSIRRFIGCHLGDAHDVRRNRLTGRHWWGKRSAQEELVEPITGRDAARLVRSLGMPDRQEEETGTTLTILDPDIGDRDLMEVAGEIQETLLWYLWPKMLSNPRGPAIKFILSVEGQEVPIPAPESFPPLDLFIEAYRGLKQDAPDLLEIWSERPIELLGHCAIRRGFRNPRRPLADPEESIIPHTACHIALMRPVELVVKYVEGTPLPSEGHEWGGVFICNDDPKVEQAFADAEPPAHDDWIPDKMPKGWPKTYVRVALSRLRQLASTYAYPDLETGGVASAQPSLAKAADRLGELLPFGSEPFGRGSGAGGGGGRGGGAGGAGGGGARGIRWRAAEPRFLRLEETDDGADAIFEVELANATNNAWQLTAQPAVVIDGELASSEDAAEAAVPFVCWEDASGDALQADPTLPVGPGTQGTFRMRVRIPPDAVVGVRLKAVEASST